MSKQATEKYLKRLKEIKVDKALTPIEICTLQPLATIEENNLNFETAYVESNYYYHSSKPEIKARIIEIALDNTKKHAPEVLENLGERAKNKRDKKG